MSISTTTSDNITRIIITGRFDLTTHKEFRATYKDMPKDNEYIVDMNRATYLDSSALGMLLLLREHSGEDSGKISIVGCNPEVKHILEVSNFKRLFSIS